MQAPHTVVSSSSWLPYLERSVPSGISLALLPTLVLTVHVPFVSAERSLCASVTDRVLDLLPRLPPRPTSYPTQHDLLYAPFYEYSVVCLNKHVSIRNTRCLDTSWTLLPLPRVAGREYS